MVPYYSFGYRRYMKNEWLHVYILYIYMYSIKQLATEITLNQTTGYLDLEFLGYTLFHVDI